MKIKFLQAKSLDDLEKLAQSFIDQGWTVANPLIAVPESQYTKETFVLQMHEYGILQDTNQQCAPAEGSSEIQSTPVEAQIAQTAEDIEVA